jgi:hypothetical protein
MREREHEFRYLFIVAGLSNKKEGVTKNPELQKEGVSDRVCVYALKAGKFIVILQRIRFVTNKRAIRTSSKDQSG